MCFLLILWSDDKTKILAFSSIFFTIKDATVTAAAVFFPTGSKIINFGEQYEKKNLFTFDKNGKVAEA